MSEKLKSYRSGSRNNGSEIIVRGKHLATVWVQCWWKARYKVLCMIVNDWTKLKGWCSICRFGTKLGSDPKLEDMMWVSLTDQLAKVIWRYQLKSVYPVHQYRTKACCTNGTVVEFVSRTVTFFRLSVSVLHFFKCAAGMSRSIRLIFCYSLSTDSRLHCRDLIFW